MTYFNETNATPETIKIRNDLHQSGDQELAVLAGNLTDAQLFKLRDAVRACDTQVAAAEMLAAD